MKKIAVALACVIFSGCAVKKLHPVTFILDHCQTIESTQVVDHATGEKYERLTCSCTRRFEKVDAQTGKMIVECQ